MCAFGSPAAFAQPAARGSAAGGARVLTATPAAAHRALRYWTPARMRRAARAGARRVALRPPPAASVQVEARPGAPVRVPARRPRRSRIAHASHVPVPDSDEIHANGRLFFRYRRYPASCSATVINTPSSNVAVTAGHCLYDPLSGVVSRHVVFVPAYDSGRRPFGSFTARATRVTIPWARRANTNFDAGVIVLNANRLGRPADVVGGSGWATGLSRWRDFDIFGYPAGALKGEKLRECLSRSYRSDRLSRLQPGPHNMRAFCDMARGASGGGWVTEDADGRYLNGVTSYRYPRNFKAIFSPYFGAAVRGLIGAAG